MRVLITVLITTVGLVGCSDQPSTSGKQAMPPANQNNNELTPADAKQLIPQAASIANKDFEILSKTPGPKKIESETLSLVLFSLNPYEKAETNPAVSNDFKYLTEQFPKPSTIAEAMWRSKSNGYATMIQPDFITDCTCKTENGTATGTVSFTAEGLYTGAVDFTAVRTDGTWRIEEFRLPNYRVTLVRGESGMWEKTPMESDGT